MLEIQTLNCGCCQRITKGRQWEKRKSGLGLCEWCEDKLAKNMSKATMINAYGYRGIHYCLKNEGTRE